MIINTNLWNRWRYTLWAPVYDAAAGLFRRRRRRSLALADIRAGERVLLVGAGTGLDLEWVPAAARITAIDLTPAMVSRLRRRAARLGLEVDARVMDGQALAFPDGAFDVVVLHLIVAVIPQPLRCLQEAARVLRPGGRAVMFDKFAPDSGPVPLWLRLLNLGTRVLATDVTRRAAPLLAAAGLRVVRDEAAGLRGLFRIILIEKS